MRDPVVLLACFFFLALAVKSRFGGAVAYWWFSFFRPQEWTWIPIDGYRLPMLATILFVVLSAFQGMLPKPVDRISGATLFFLVLATLASLTSGCEPLEFRQDYLFDFAVTVVAILTTIQVIKTWREFLILVGVVTLSVLFFSGKAGLATLVGGGTYYGADTMGGAFSGSNAFALGSAAFLFLGLGTVAWSRKSIITDVLRVRGAMSRFIASYKWLGMILCFGTAMNVIALFSRGSALSMAVSLAGYGLLSRWFKPAALAGLSVVFALALVFIELPEGYMDRLGSAFADEEELDESAASRPYFWRIAVEVAFDYPLGVGPGCYNTVYPIYDESGGRYGNYRTVHSSHFEALSEVGFLGAFAWVFVFIATMLALLRARSRAIKRDNPDSPEAITLFVAANALICGIFCYFIGGSFYALAYSPVIWFMYGCASIALKLARNENAPATHGR